MPIKLIFSVVICCLSSWTLATPQIQHWQSDSGAKVLFVEDHSIPMLDVAVSVPAGGAFDRAEKAGVAGLTHALLDLGVVGMNEDEVARSLADIGAQLGGGVGQDRASVSLRTLSSIAERKQALAVMAKVLQQPVFPEAVLAREKARRIAGLKEAETRPKSIVSKAFNKAVFGAHPYGVPLSGDVASVEKITVEDLRDFYQQYYRAGSTVVAIMGDVSRSDAEAIAQQLTAGLPSGRVTAELPAVVTKITPSEQRIAHPATQSHILMGTPGIARSDPDFFALYLGNHILGGGGFTARLMTEVREKRGFAYDVHSYFAPLKLPGTFQIGLQTKKEQADEALKVGRQVLADFIAEGPTEKELIAAKQNIIGGFPLRIDGNRKILNYLSMIGANDFPLTYLDDWTDNFYRVTLAQIREAFTRHVDPQALATVIVGAPETADVNEVRE